MKKIFCLMVLGAIFPALSHSQEIELYRCVSDKAITYSAKRIEGQKCGKVDVRKARFNIGMRWAKQNAVTEPSQCAAHSNSKSFIEGCKAYINTLTP